MPSQQPSPHAVRGLRTVIYPVGDLERATEWYAQALGIAPYFSEPFYVGFNVGGFELGLDPDIARVGTGNRVVAYWGVGDAEPAYARLLTIGARAESPVRDVGGGIKVGVVVDPFGNAFGVIENPHFKPADVR